MMESLLNYFGFFVLFWKNLINLPSQMLIWLIKNYNLNLQNDIAKMFNLNYKTNAWRYDFSFFF